MKAEYFVLLSNDICCSLQFRSHREEPKSYDGKFVTAKYSSINYGATLIQT